MLSSPSGSSSKSRKDVATQACETCRKRKSKCDEKRPKCTLCQRLNLDCHYKEKDEVKRTRDEETERILEVLQRVESKIDNITGTSSVSQTQATHARFPFHAPQHLQRSEFPGHPIEGEEEHGDRSSRDRLSDRSSHLTVPHKIIFWPTIYSQLMEMQPQAGPDLQAIYEGGTPWLISQEFGRQSRVLPFDDGLPYVVASNVDIGEASFRSRVSFPSLTTDYVKRCTDAYFGTFNMLYPVLDYDLFKIQTLEPVIRNGFAYGDSASVLALMALALGDLAATIIGDIPVPKETGMSSGIGSGIGGGTVQRPPGLQLFNEARARIGSIFFHCDLINVQIHLLVATYFEAYGCHVEFWHSTASASMICQVLISSPGIEWNTPQGDVVKRAYWTCVINEDLYHLDLDLARTLVHELEDIVPLPHFDRMQSRTIPATDGGIDSEALLQYYFVAKASLKRLISRIHEAIHLRTRDSNQSESLDDYRDPPIHIIRELSRQLESWRTLLPIHLQWSDEEIYNEREVEQQNVDPALVTRDLKS